MRRNLLSFVLLLATTTLALAQSRPPVPAIAPATNGSVTTLAPTPNQIPDRVAPADRAGNDASDPAGPIASTPFSGAPQAAGGGQSSPSIRGTQPDAGRSTPSLGK